MSSIALDFAGLFVALGIGAVAALPGTPLLWKLAEGLPTVRRGVLAVPGALGLAGLAAARAPSDREPAAFAAGSALLLPLLALPGLLILHRRQG